MMTESPSMPVAIPETQSAPSRPLTPQRPFHWGTGRRKSSIARVRIKPGTGKFLINDREVDDFFRLPKDRTAVRNPLQVIEAAGSYDVFVNVHGGGISGQSGAVVLGLSRALIKADGAFESKLKGQNLLTRDSREVERKKYGRAGARKRFQFSKR